MILLVLSALLLLAVLHRFFRTATGRRARAAVLVVTLAAGVNYWLKVRDTNAAVRTTNSPAITCPFPEERTGDLHHCYNPHNRDEFTQHLKDCKIKPSERPAEDSPSADSRGVPCDYFDQFENTSSAN